MRRMLWPLLAACLLLAPFLYRDSAQAVNVAGCPTSAAPCYVTGTGTAGSAAAGVVTVQGIASGTNLGIAGTVTSQFSTANAATTPHICGSHVYKHITSGTDTQIVAASGSNTIYICDYEFSASGALNWYFEKSSTGTCASPTQIDMLWTLAANGAKAAANSFYRGFSTGASQQLCVNTSAGSLDISVYYDQY